MAEKKISRVTLNGVPILDIHEDTVTPETLAKNETAHDQAGNNILGIAEFGGDTTDCYKITDPATTDISNDDYIPFHDVSDSETPKKKTLFSNIIDKLKSVFLQKTSFKPEGIGSGYCEGTVSGSAITATIDGFVLTKGGVISLKMTNGMPTGATLNISNTGAKSVYWANGTAIRDKDIPTLWGLTWLLMYDGTHYLIIGVNNAAIANAQSYVADTSGALTLNNYYASNAFQLKYYLTDDNLYYNYYKNNTWNGDIRLAKYNDIYNLLNSITSTNITSGDLNNYTAPGLYYWSLGNYPNITNVPPISDSYIMWSMYTNGNEWKRQIAFRRGVADQIWTRVYNNSSSTWSKWNYIGSSVNYGSEITSNADLNSYTVSGVYNIATNAIATTISNMPIQIAGKLIVIDIASEHYRVQQFIPYNSQSGCLYQRSWNNNGSANTWYEWLQYLTMGSNISILTGKSNDIDAQVADNGVSSTKYPSLNNLTDKNNLIIARDEAVVQPNGNIRHYWYLRNYNGSTSAVGQKGLYIEMDKTGTVNWNISDAFKFNAAIGCGIATCSTATATDAKEAALAGYELIANGFVTVLFTNEVTANATLNINNKGAKNIRYRGSNITAGIIRANDRVTFVYNGTYYELISIDRQPYVSGTTLYI